MFLKFGWGETCGPVDQLLSIFQRADFHFSTIREELKTRMPLLLDYVHTKQRRCDEWKICVRVC